MARPLSKTRHPVTNQIVRRCFWHPWQKIREGGGCPHCERKAQKRAKKIQKRHQR